AGESAELRAGGDLALPLLRPAGGNLGAAGMGNDCRRQHKLLCRDVSACQLDRLRANDGGFAAINNPMSTTTPPTTSGPTSSEPPDPVTLPQRIIVTALWSVLL